MRELELIEGSKCRQGVWAIRAIVVASEHTAKFLD